MPTINFYHCDKRLNSTKIPAGTTQYPIQAYTVKLKDDCDVLRPVFQMTRDSVTQNPYYNYVDWNETTSLRRYYYIVNRTYRSNNMLEIECEIDVLATYKNFILDSGTKYYVARSASSKSAFLTDTRFPTVQNKTVERKTFSPFDVDNGFYVIGVIQQIGPGSQGDGYSFSRGSVYYYTAKQSEFESLLAFLNNPGAAYSDYNPLSHIVSCIYIPDDETGSSVSSAMFVRGGDSFNWTHTKITTGSRGTHSIPISSQTLYDHPDSASDKYLNYPPFSHYELFAGPFGNFELDRSLMGTGNTPSISFSVNVDCATGDAWLYVYSGSQTLINTAGKVGIDILLAQQTQRSASDLIRMDNMRNSAILSGLATAGNAVLNRNAGGLAAAAINAVNAANDYTLTSYLTNIPKVSCINGNGNFASILRAWSIQAEFAIHTAVDNVHAGAPLGVVISLNGLSGYTQCIDARYNLMCSTKTEREAIDSFLNSGFYIE